VFASRERSNAPGTTDPQKQYKQAAVQTKFVTDQGKPKTARNAIRRWINAENDNRTSNSS